MERLGILFGLCTIAILTEITSAGLLATTEAARNDVHEANSTESNRTDLPKWRNTNNSTDCSRIDRTKRGPEVGGKSAEDPSRSNKVSNASATTVGDPVEDAQREKHVGCYEGNVARPDHQQNPPLELSSHDILLDPGLISARLTRQAGRKGASGSSIEDNLDDAVRGSDDSSRPDSALKDDLGVAEDRYPSMYPYWYQRQYSNQRYRANDRRDPHRNYLRYPVFPGR